MDSGRIDIWSWVLTPILYICIIGRGKCMELVGWAHLDMTSQGKNLLIIAYAKEPRRRFFLLPLGLGLTSALVVWQVSLWPVVHPQSMYDLIDCGLEHVAMTGHQVESIQLASAGNALRDIALGHPGLVLSPRMTIIIRLSSTQGRGWGVEREINNKFNQSQPDHRVHKSVQSSCRVLGPINNNHKKTGTTNNLFPFHFIMRLKLFTFFPLGQGSGFVRVTMGWQLKWCC